MGRPRTPTNVLALKGAFKKDPQRIRVDPDSQGPIGNAPARLTDGQKQIWREIKASAPVGVLTKADRFAVEELCILVDERRTKPADMTDGRRALLRQYLGQFGMTPADRAKISRPPPPAKNAFEDI